MYYYFLLTADVLLCINLLGGWNMSIEMSIARAATAMNEFKLQQALQIEMLKKTMELQELQVSALIGKLPDISGAAGGIVDVKA